MALLISPFYAGFCDVAGQSSPLKITYTLPGETTDAFTCTDADGNERRVEFRSTASLDGSRLTLHGELHSTRSLDVGGNASTIVKDYTESIVVELSGSGCRLVAFHSRMANVHGPYETEETLSTTPSSRCQLLPRYPSS